MNEAMRHEIMQQHQAGLSQRAIAHALGISRKVVRNVLARWHAQRDGQAASRPKLRRDSIIDPYEPILKELLARYPNLTVERALQELQARLSGPVYDGPAACSLAAADCRAGARAALRDWAQRAGPDGLRRL
jgi:transposase